MAQIDTRLPNLCVSRETVQKLHVLMDLVRKWSAKINLVSSSQLDDLWLRHIVDSAQVYLHAPKGFDIWLDIGSGGGFPGLVVAILANELNPAGEIVMVESDQRKATFLQSAAGRLELTTHVIAERVDRIVPLSAAIITARALAPLDTLLEYVNLHQRPDGLALFPKGKTVSEEILRAQNKWRFNSTLFPSVTDPDARIVKVWDLKHV